jgi:hypothetical protein
VSDSAGDGSGESSLLSIGMETGSSSSMAISERLLESFLVLVPRPKGHCALLDALGI